MNRLLLSYVFTMLAFGGNVSDASLANGLTSQESVKNNPTSPPAGIQQQNQSNKQTPQTESVPGPSSRISEPQSHQQEADPKDKPEWASHWLWKDINWSGLAQASVGAFGLWIIWRTLKAVEIQAIAAQNAANAAIATVGAMRETAAKQLRAYVFPHDATIDTSPGQHKVQIKIKNTGQTPAYDVRCTVTLTDQLAPPAPFIYPEESDVPVSQMFLPPGSFVTNTPPVAFTPERLRGWHSGEQVLYMSGMIRYRHPFSGDIDNVTVFRLMYRGKGDIWELCTEGNDAT